MHGRGLCQAGLRPIWSRCAKLLRARNIINMARRAREDPLRAERVERGWWFGVPFAIIRTVGSGTVAQAAGSFNIVEHPVRTVLIEMEAKKCAYCLHVRAHATETPAHQRCARAFR